MATSDPQPEDTMIDDDTLYLIQINEMMNDFAVEAFKFLMQNAHLWIEFPKDFLIRHTYLEKSLYFKEHIAKAVITITCIFRNEYIKGCRHMFEVLQDIDTYSTFLNSYIVPRDENYFYNFITRVAFVFSATMLMYQEGYDFIVASRNCLASYSNTVYFDTVGGWKSLDNLALMMLPIYDLMATVVRKDFHNEENIKGFLKFVRKIERRERYFLNKWVWRVPKMSNVDEIRRNVSAKYYAVLNFNPQRIFPGYVVFQENVIRHCEESTKTRSNEAAKVPAVEAMEHDREIVEDSIMDSSTNVKKIGASEEAADGKSFQSEEMVDSFSTASAACAASSVTTEIMEPALRDLDETKSVFVINERFLAKRAMIKRERSKRKRVIKIYSPYTRSESISENLTKIFDENLENENYLKIRDGVLAVCPPGCHISDDNSKIVVLDTSSEEDDDENDYPLSKLNYLFQYILHPSNESGTSYAAQSRSQVERYPETIMTPMESEAMGYASAAAPSSSRVERRSRTSVTSLGSEAIGYASAAAPSSSQIERRSRTSVTSLGSEAIGYASAAAPSSSQVERRSETSMTSSVSEAIGHSSEMAQFESQLRELSIEERPMDQLPERIQYVPTRSTGAIPKSTSYIFRQTEENMESNNNPEDTNNNAEKEEGGPTVRRRRQDSQN